MTPPDHGHEADGHESGLGAELALSASMEHEGHDGSPTNVKGGVEAELFATIVRGAGMLVKEQLAPAGADIDEEVAQLQHDVHSVTNDANNELAMVEGELARLSTLVTDFQAHIARFLSSGHM